MTDTDARTAIDAKGLVKRFGDVRALDEFDIRVEEGHIHGLVGPNGAEDHAAPSVLRPGRR
jgi:ABC-type branched-subunit amino acid transport system ATPase component